MRREDRRAALAAYKQRKPPAGIYAVRCTVSGRCWVGSARDLDAVRNRHWFALRLGSNRHTGLQQAWRDHGEAAFAFERVEVLSQDLADWQRDQALKDRLVFWLAEMKAEAI
jgi:hypothetical protein